MQHRSIHRGAESSSPAAGTRHQQADHAADRAEAALAAGLTPGSPGRPARAIGAAGRRSDTAFATKANTAMALNRMVALAL
eukprot:SAG31_NODE_28510_length_409_cov_0.796774_1_plen_80_part_01